MEERRRAPHVHHQDGLHRGFTSDTVQVLMKPRGESLEYLILLSSVYTSEGTRMCCLNIIINIRKSKLKSLGFFCFLAYTCLNIIHQTSTVLLMNPQIVQRFFEKLLLSTAPTSAIGGGVMFQNLR